MTAKESEVTVVVESHNAEVVRSCGQILAAKREALGLSDVEVAEKLNLLPAMVRTLEADNFSAIRSPVFCRGYLKNYAKLLDLNVDEVMGLYESQLPPELPVQRIEPESTVVFKPVVIGSSPTFFKRHIKSIVATAASISVLAILVTLNNSSINAKLTSTTDESTSETPLNAGVTLPLNTASTVQTLVKQPVSTQEAIASMPILLPGNDLHIADHSGKEVASHAAPLKVQTAAISANNAVVKGEDRLSLQFTDNCWVEIRDSKNVVIASGLYRANDVLNLSGKAPFKLHLGFAPGVNVAFNGEHVDIQKGTSNGHTARLVVGSS